MFGFQPAIHQLLKDLANAGMQIQPQGASRAGLGSVQDHEVTDRVTFGRNSVGYDTYGRLYSLGSPVSEVIGGQRGIHVSGEFVNLFPNGNTDFENGLTGWTSALSASTNGSATASTEQAFVGSQSAKIYGGDNAGDYVRIFQQTTLTAGPYTMAFAVYSPYKRPTSDDGFFGYMASDDLVTTSLSIPAGKKGWWWVVITRDVAAAPRRFGVRVGAGQTLYVDAFCLVAGSVGPIAYIGAQKAAENIQITSRDIPEQFIAGVLVRTDHADDVIKPDTAARLLTMRAPSGDEYRIEYRPSVKKFAAVKKIGEVEVEVLSNTVAYNRRAVIGVAVQQTEEALRLHVLAPRAVVVNFDDGRQSVYTNAFPVMQKYGIPGTFHVLTGLVGTTTYCTEYELHELKEAGWCISNHTVTHADLTLLDEAGQRAEIEPAMEWLRVRGFDYHLFCSPYGKTNDTTLRLLRQLGIRLHRNYRHYPQVWPVPDIYALEAPAVNHVDTPETIIGQIDAAMTTYKVINMTWHYIEAGEADAQYDPAQFAQIMQDIAAKGHPCYTMADLLDAYELGKPIGKVEQFSTASATTISGVNNIYIGHDHAGANHFDGAYLDWFATGDFYGGRELAKRWGCKW